MGPLSASLLKPQCPGSTLDKLIHRTQADYKNEKKGKKVKNKSTRSSASVSFRFLRW